MSELILSLSRRLPFQESLEFVGFLTAVVGTAMLSLNVGLEFVGFCSYAVSNIAWVAFSVQRGYRWLLSQNAIFMVFTTIGLINFWPI